MIHELITLARSTGTPLIEGNTAVFVWQGQQAPALIGDFTDWEEAPLPLNRIAPAVWVHRLTLPPGAYLEYSFYADGQRVADPLNPRTSSDGFGHRNHWFYMPPGAPTPLATRQPKTPRGVVTRHLLPTNDLAVGRQRTVFLYRPPCDEPCPLLVVYDGPDYLRRARLPVIVDNLIAQGRIRPLAMALLANGHQARLLEYGCNEMTVAFLLESVLPLARATLNLQEARSEADGSYGIMGASMGGLMALYTALRLPHLFSRVLSQSGAFSLGGNDLIVYDLVRQFRPLPLKIWMDVGLFEGLLQANRRMHALLDERGYAPAYREYPAGHNYPAWRDDLWRGLEYLFPPIAPSL